MKLSTRSIYFFAPALVLCILLTIGVLTSRWHAENLYDEEVSNREELKRELLSIKSQDHVYGASEAPISLVVYSDVSCQYCRFLYPKLKNIVDSYEGKVALVYRHIPLFTHRGTIDEEEIASECVFKQVGNEGFFKFMDNLFAQLPDGEQVEDISILELLGSASYAGADVEAVRDCISARQGTEIIESFHNGGQVLGVRSIPRTFIVSEEEVYDIVGNKSEPTFNAIIDNMLGVIQK